jgi:cytosine/uracil/thiamine/allantoin permease
MNHSSLIVQSSHDHIVYSSTVSSRWGNRNIFPIILEQQNYTAIAFWSYWIIAGISIGCWTYESSIITTDLSSSQAIGASFPSILAYLCGEAGLTMHLG